MQWLNVTIVTTVTPRPNSDGALNTKGCPKAHQRTIPFISCDAVTMVTVKCRGYSREQK